MRLLPAHSTVVNGGNRSNTSGATISPLWIICYNRRYLYAGHANKKEAAYSSDESDDAVHWSSGAARLWLSEYPLVLPSFKNITWRRHEQSRQSRKASEIAACPQRDIVHCWNQSYTPAIAVINEYGQYKCSANGIRMWHIKKATDTGYGQLTDGLAVSYWIPVVRCSSIYITKQDVSTLQRFFCHFFSRNNVPRTYWSTN